MLKPNNSASIRKEALVLSHLAMSVLEKCRRSNNKKNESNTSFCLENKTGLTRWRVGVWHAQQSARSLDDRTSSSSETEVEPVIFGWSRGTDRAAGVLLHSRPGCLVVPVISQRRRQSLRLIESAELAVGLPAKPASTTCELDPAAVARSCLDNALPAASCPRS